MEWWHVYLFTRLDGLNWLLRLLTVLSVIGAIISVVIYLSADPTQWFSPEFKDKSLWLKTVARLPAKILPIASLILALVSIAVPTQKEAAAIYLLPKLAHSDFAKEAQKIPTDAAKLMRLKLESWITDIEPGKAEKSVKP